MKWIALQTIQTLNLWIFQSFDIKNSFGISSSRGSCSSRAIRRVWLLGKWKEWIRFGWSFANKKSMAILFWYLFDTIFPFTLTPFACFGPKLVILLLSQLLLRTRKFKTQWLIVIIYWWTIRSWDFRFNLVHKFRFSLFFFCLKICFSLFISLLISLIIISNNVSIFLLKYNL